jgi:hypothetical protein
MNKEASEIVGVIEIYLKKVVNPNRLLQGKNQNLYPIEIPAQGKTPSFVVMSGVTAI